MRYGGRVWKGIGILLITPIDASEILFYEDRQNTAGAKVDSAVDADLLAFRPGARHFTRHEDCYPAGRRLDFETRPAAFLSKGVSQLRTLL
jgi:hypothetical protein